MTDTSASGTVEEPEWVVCPACRTMLYRKRLERTLRVCPECGDHHRLTAAQRIEQLFDPGTVEPVEHRVHSVDVLGFTDTEPYARRLDRARTRTGLDEAVVVVRGSVGGAPLVAAVMDFRFLGGSLGSGAGELVTRAAETALGLGHPLLLVSASGGARMQEGALSLMQMAKTSQALGQLDEAGILTISLITDPTFGGVAASFATLCDVIIAEPRARLGFAGRRVIEQTIKQQLPPGFQTAEFLLEHGLVDAIRPRSELRGTLLRILESARPGRPGAGEPGHRNPDDAAVVTDPAALSEVDAWNTVQEARELGRPTTMQYLAGAFDRFDELHGDRMGGDCPAIVGGLARLGRYPVVVVGHQKGATIDELAARNYAMPSPGGYRKAARLFRLAAKLGLPVVTFVDTPGAFPGLEAEEQGQAIAIAENIRLMAGLPVPVVTLITGEGGSGGALALAVADEVLICSRATYSVISPEGCSAILWNDRAQAPKAAEMLRLDARELLRLGVVDGVVPEPERGAQSDHRLAAERVRHALEAAIGRLSTTDGPTLVKRRRNRFRSFGAGTAPQIATNGVSISDDTGHDDEPSR
ncbi:acetyl-CoA carboxylase, carboxyltransferase subunit beta [Saccharomonospora saliphila]|uniref:acetyl-CoA carboxylase, carboxyltransferase subunit beta n=1 Tax=Saccharomonospora saliphila TaxID=369829 RepID=UPI0006626708|nr:acetyl-CoA carboxylase, carboxyltransferase subunit beta [Saccharomonospora saliphila]